ncbi:hypothetical protein SAMN02745132_02853 [Enterovibrio nigricans DSM 22720]|uniref:Nickel transport protein n=2 Tax=Enterovibrio nigricans TaxID=504469 RepID=A0A1T4UZ03_9GAMM|nr:hypothetical protein SAMN02745132_02853 [Enterovibrio nigricans DSM 22720]
MKLFGVLLINALFVFAAEAHKVVHFTHVEGSEIHGEVGFSNGAFARKGTIVEVSEADGQSLGIVEVGDKGDFVFIASKPIDHHFRVNLGAGHVATFVVDSEQLALKASENIAQNGHVSSFDSQALQQLKQIREDVYRLEKTLKISDVLAALGFLFGMMGLWMFMRSSRGQ